MDKIRYPLGRYHPPKTLYAKELSGWIGDIEKLPSALVRETENLTDDQLDTPYRKNGWTVRQLVHHIADSHANAYIRFKLALTEDHPTIKAYKQDLWAGLRDSKLPLESSLKIIEGIHCRWVHLLKSLSPEELKRELIHPESGTVVLEFMIGDYAWHSRHHLAHITALKKRNNW